MIEDSGRTRGGGQRPVPTPIPRVRYRRPVRTSSTAPSACVAPSSSCGQSVSLSAVLVQPQARIRTVADIPLAAAHRGAVPGTP